jgi:hypothetical protein
MFPSPEFMATPEINYRRDRIAADLRGRKPARSRLHRRRHHEPVPEQRRGDGDAL